MRIRAVDESQKLRLIDTAECSATNIINNMGTMSSTVITETGCDPHRAASGLDTEIEDLTELSWREKSLYAFSSMCCLKQTNSEKF